MSLSEQELEQRIQANHLNAPRITPKDVDDNIESVEIVTYVTRAGKVLRWAVLNTRSGFAVTGNPSASVSTENDHVPTGEEVAIANARERMWELMGYELSCRLMKSPN